MHLSRNCPFSNKTNLHLELPGYRDSNKKEPFVEVASRLRLVSASRGTSLEEVEPLPVGVG